MTTAQILNGAADLIEPDGAWCQYRFAADWEGRGREPLDKDACRWCVLGAIERVVGGHGRALYAEALLSGVVDDVSLDIWNDTYGRQQAEVVAALRKAAALAEGA